MCNHSVLWMEFFFINLKKIHIKSFEVQVKHESCQEYIQPPSAALYLRNQTNATLIQLAQWTFPCPRPSGKCYC